MARAISESVPAASVEETAIKGRKAVSSAAAATPHRTLSGPYGASFDGTDGKGQNEIPRLAGQLYDYTIGQLSGWAKARGQGSAIDTSAVMAPTAHNLSRSQVEAVAAYVSYLQ